MRSSGGRGGAIAYIPGNMLHKGVGHLGACVLTGQTPISVPAVPMECSRDNQFVLAGGTTANIVAGGLCFIRRRRFRRLGRLHPGTPTRLGLEKGLSRLRRSHLLDRIGIHSARVAALHRPPRPRGRAGCATPLLDALLLRRSRRRRGLAARPAGRARNAAAPDCPQRCVYRRGRRAHRRLHRNPRPRAKARRAFPSLSPVDTRLALRRHRRAKTIQ
jgi:hypothetical protein